MAPSPLHGCMHGHHGGYVSHHACTTARDSPRPPLPPTFPLPRHLCFPAPPPCPPHLPAPCPTPSLQFGCGVKAIQVRDYVCDSSTLAAAPRAFYLVRKDGSLEDFSYLKCCSTLFPNEVAAGAGRAGWGGRGRVVGARSSPMRWQQAGE